MHRVRAARRLHLPARPLVGFSLQGFVDGGGLQFGEPRRVRLKAWVSAMLGHQLADTKLCENQRLEPCEDGFTLTATMSYSWRLRWWILSKSGDIEILAPKELRSEIGKLLTQTAARYASRDGTA
jgi:predicted DNA-binding transcriptional regulator YafY